MGDAHMIHVSRGRSFWPIGCPGATYSVDPFQRSSPPLQLQTPIKRADLRCFCMHHRARVREKEREIDSRARMHEEAL